MQSTAVCVCVTDERNMGPGCEELYKPRVMSWLSTLTEDSAQTVGQSVFQGDFENVTRIQQFHNFHLVIFFLNFPLAEGPFMDSKRP